MSYSNGHVATLLVVVTQSLLLGLLEKWGSDFSFQVQGRTISHLPWQAEPTLSEIMRPCIAKSRPSLRPPEATPGGEQVEWKEKRQKEERQKK